MTSTSRRSLLAALPAVAVAGALPAGDTFVSDLDTFVSPDPIFTAIEAYKQANQAYYEAWEDWEDSLDAWRAEYPAIDAAHYAAIEGLESTIPTTLAGCAAATAFWLGDDPEMGMPDWHLALMSNVLTALERLAAA